MHYVAALVITNVTIVIKRHDLQWQRNLSFVNDILAHYYMTEVVLADLCTIIIDPL